MSASLGLRNLWSPAASSAPATHAINALGLDLLIKNMEPGSNALLSPYSIQSALAMTFAGSAGNTNGEMARVLHYPASETDLHQSFAALQNALAEIEKSTVARLEETKKWGGPGEPITLTVANRLFGQQGYEFRTDFLNLLKDTYHAPLVPMDFARDTEQARAKINGWVENQTRERIRDLIPPGGLGLDTRMALVNAIYLKAPWQNEFYQLNTKPVPFYVDGVEPQNVPTMYRQGQFGYSQCDGFSAITIPYSADELQFLVLLPNAKDGLSLIESKLTPKLLTSFADTPQAELKLYLPKLRMEPPLLQLGRTLRNLGMTTAFDVPQGTANFDRMAPRRPEDYLYISEVFHKTFLAVDERGTEAAAATAVVARAGGRYTPPPSIEVRVDHPFLFAIQHRPSGACLFLGRMTNPC